MLLIGRYILYTVRRLPTLPATSVKCNIILQKKFCFNGSIYTENVSSLWCIFLLINYIKVTRKYRSLVSALQRWENKIHIIHAYRIYISVYGVHVCDMQSWAYCAEERKSASFFFLRRNANLGLQKRDCALCALTFWTVGRQLWRQHFGFRSIV